MPTTDELQAQINAIQQQLNQIIGMSNDDYVLAYSGEEVEALLAKASAAATYGYAGALDTVSGATDEAFLAAVEAKLAAMPYMGAMQINWGSYPALDGLARVGTLAKHNGGQYASITGYSYGGTAITRCKNAGTWGPWEWVNPPLVNGVEYRTTERYLGKPVYCKLVNCGAGPNATRKTVSAGISNIDKAVAACGSWGSVAIPYEWFSGDTRGAQAMSITLNGSNIEIASTANYSGNTIYARIKYTKTTD